MIQNLDCGLLTELQAGSYIFLDADYSKNERAGSDDAPQFQNSLFIVSTVVSNADAGAAVVDAGLKAIAFDSGLPAVAGRPGVSYIEPSDEHGMLGVSGNDRLKVGDKVFLIPGHCDPTVNLHNWYVGLRNGCIESLWPVAARGG